MLIRFLLAVVTTVGALTAGSITSSAPAMAAPTQCAGQASKQIGSTTRVGTRYTRFGWAEWRWGTSGRCYQRKWILIHITEPGLYMSGGEDWRYGTSLGTVSWGVEVWDRNNTSWGGGKAWADVLQGTYHVGVGTWSSYGYYGYHKSLGGKLLGATTKGNWLDFSGATYND